MFACLYLFFVHRISVSHNDKGILAVPLDNKHIKLYDLAGNRLGQLPRNNRQVCSLCFDHPCLQWSTLTHFVWFYVVPSGSQTHGVQCSMVT